MRQERLKERLMVGNKPTLNTRHMDLGIQRPLQTLNPNFRRIRVALEILLVAMLPALL